MRVLVNLLWCRPGRVGGSEEYLVRQLLGLTEVAPGVELRVAAPSGFAAAHPDLAERVDLTRPPALVDRRAGGRRRSARSARSGWAAAKPTGAATRSSTSGATSVSPSS